MSIFLQAKDRLKVFSIPFSASQNKRFGAIFISAIVLMSPIIYYTMAEEAFGINKWGGSNNMFLSLLFFLFSGFLSTFGVLRSNLANYVVFSVITFTYISSFFLSILLILLNSA